LQNAHIACRQGFTARSRVNEASVVFTLLFGVCNERRDYRNHPSEKAA